MTSSSVSEISHAIAAQLAGQTPSGLLVRSADQVRALRDANDCRALCVIDDPVLDPPPLPDNPAHALAITAINRGDAEILEIQSDLFELFHGATVLTCHGTFIQRRLESRRF